MLVKKLYDSTAIGAIGTLTYGGVTNDQIQYEAFAEQVADLESLDAQGLVKITHWHHESTTGNRYVDLVQFKRLQ